jgi:membrane associated rhomboid family serine protease
MIPLRDENPTHITPVVTRTLIAINVLAFLYEVSMGSYLGYFVRGWGLIPERLGLAFTGAEPLAPAVLTVLTSMFLHGGWVHLIGNMWYLWVFGDNIEDRLGHVRFLGFYLMAGVVSAALHTLTNPGSPIPTVGASGAIAGVLGAYAFAFPRARVITLVPIFIFLQIMALPALLVLGLWFVVQIFSGSLALGTGATGGVAWWAHIGGFAFGVLFMAIFGGVPPASGEPRGGSRAWVEE